MLVYLRDSVQAFASERIEPDRGVAVDVLRITEVRICDAVDLGDFYLVKLSHLFGQVAPFGRQALTRRAPGREKIHDPQFRRRLPGQLYETMAVQRNDRGTKHVLYEFDDSGLVRNPLEVMDLAAVVQHRRGVRSDALLRAQIRVQRAVDGAEFNFFLVEMLTRPPQLGH